MAGYAFDVVPDIDHAELSRFVIYRAVVGSRAFGLDDAESDTDRRGFYLPPADLHWSLAGVPAQLESDAEQSTYWEIEKFIRLALKANPNVLECLWSPLVEHVTPLAADLRERRGMFLSRVAYDTFNGYVDSQFRKLQNTLARGDPAKPKHVMHLIRLLLSGLHLVRTGDLQIRPDDADRARLLAIKRGEFALGEADAWRRSLHEELDAAMPSSPLPDEPDVAAANAFLIRARRSALELS